jgi:hypothetical protein
MTTNAATRNRPVAVAAVIPDTADMRRPVADLAALAAAYVAASAAVQCVFAGR